MKPPGAGSPRPGPACLDLEGWLAHIEALNPRSIDLGLRRVRQVAESLDVLKPAPLSVIVAGTNGKGTTSVCLEQILLAAGLRVGCTLSPHLHSFNERVRLNGAEAEDAVLCEAFATVEAARRQLPLTYFEFSCLAALHCFKAASVDVAILEVGLGGRLDAFNIVDAEVAVVTSIDLDHMDYLGATREAIGREKAGVFRPGQRILLGEDMPESVLQAVRDCASRPLRLGREIRAAAAAGEWDLEVDDRVFSGLPGSGLPLGNCALAAAAALVVDSAFGGDRVGERSLRRGVASAWLPGRLESIVADGRQWWVDVAHNPLGARFLAAEIPRRWPAAAVVALFGNLADKDSRGIFAALRGVVRHWVLVDTQGARGLSALDLAARGAPPGSAVAGSLRNGLRLARSLAGPSDVILAFGSFAVAAAVRVELLNSREKAEPEGAEARTSPLR